MMNKNANNLNQNQDQLSEQQLNELENDAVWSLLSEVEKNSTVNVSPMFTRNVMREIRLNHSQNTPQSLWSRLFSPRFNKLSFGLGLGAAAALAFIVITQMTEQNQNPGSGDIATTNELSNELGELSIEEITTFVETEEDQFTEEMLEIVNQDPFFLSEEDIERAMQL